LLSSKKKYPVFSLGILLSLCSLIWASPNSYWVNSEVSLQKLAASDTTEEEEEDEEDEDNPFAPKKKKSTQKYQPSKFPTYQLQDRMGDPLYNKPSKSPLILGLPSNIKTSVELDTSMQYYSVYEQVGNFDYRPATTLTFDEYVKYRNEQINRDYLRTKTEAAGGQSAVTGKGLIPKIYISPVFDRIFGGNFVDIRPNGNVSLQFGGRWQRTDNPSIPIRQQRNGAFDFDQQISLNLIGKIGEKLKITANWDTKASFDFENNIRIEYTGFPEEIIKKIEAGNVSMPIPSTLITGAQNLFGIKTQLQFGRLSVSTIASQQRGKSESITLQGGVQRRLFEVRASDYEENRHFFLSHYHRSKYEDALKGLPAITSGVTVTRVEVYVTNRQNNTNALRNIVAFMDLGESQPYRPQWQSNAPAFADNNANTLFGQYLSNTSVFRDPDNVAASLTGPPYNLVRGEDFEIIRGARKLTDREFTFHPELGYISLNIPMRADEVLAVSFQYSDRGVTHKVGEMVEDYANRSEGQNIILKLLRPTNIQTRLPIWDLMMKNVYSLSASQITRQNFQLRVIYKDDASGIDNPSLHEGQRLRDIPLVQITNLDRLNPNGDPPADGNFDFIEGTTIDVRNGRIFFPVLEPFGKHLLTFFDPAIENGLIQKYVYSELYDSTRADAQQLSNKNKFFLSGSFASGGSGAIQLPGLNIAPGSVQISAGSIPLQEGTDYTVDYGSGQVNIINEGISASGREIRISYEKADLFNFQAKTLLGMRADYRVSRDVNIGGTLMHLSERPLISRVSIGDEPVRNSIYGLDVSLKKDSRFITKMVDKLPLIQTKAPSTVQLTAEFAQLIPGNARLLGRNGVSFIDDFEGAETPYDFTRVPQRWRLGSTPQGIPGAELFDPQFAYKRAKLSWYSIDNIFYRSQGRSRPNNINEQDMKNHYVRAIGFNEVLRNRDPTVINNNEFTFDLAYYPEERGMYNYNPDLTPDGKLKNPKGNYAAITRAINFETDFDNANVEYIEFWLLNPFIQGPDGVVLDGVRNTNNDTGGELFFNLGSVSEDVMRDGRHAFENGLPIDGNFNNTDLNSWGRVTRQQYLTNAFDNIPGARSNQDVGLDGLKSADEPGFYSNFVQAVNTVVTDANAKQKILSDPSADDFKYYLGNDPDNQNLKVLQRYKDFSGTEANSPESSGNLPFIPSSSTLPDNEDLNQDLTVSDQESYFEYRVPLRPGLRKGQGYIVDETAPDPAGPTWYQFRIPIREFNRTIGNITNFKSIRFMRMYVTGWDKPVVLRFVNLQLVASQWRRYLFNLLEPGLYLPPEPYKAGFTIGTVNIEENGTVGTGKIPYVLPPGINRDRDNFSQVSRRLNEQSLQLCVEDLQDKDARAVFKNVNMNFIVYKRVKMFIHAQSSNPNTRDGQMSVFIRMGTDFNENYYEIEVPLRITPNGTTDPGAIWPLENEIDIALNDLTGTKSNRNRLRGELRVPFTREGLGEDGRHTVTVLGNPDLSAVRTIMIGIKNRSTVNDDLEPKTMCIWVNELRMTDFDKEPGWAATGRLNTKLADLATVSASGRYTTIGFGGLQQRIAERSRATTTQYDIQTNITLDKFFPEKWGIRVPLFLSYENVKIRPQFSPIDPDVPLEAALDAIEDKDERRDYERKLIDLSTRRSLNFANIQKIKTKQGAKSRIWDIENFSVNYAYNDVMTSNFQTASYLLRNQRGGLAWNYTSQGLSFEPLKNSKMLSSKYLALVKDFNINFFPSALGFRADLDRRFVRTQLRNAQLGTEGIIPTWEKAFLFNRTYTMRWNLTKALAIDYNANVNAIIDEPEGDLDTQLKRDSVIKNLQTLGRMKLYNQLLGVNYTLPLDKIPFLNWMGGDVRYSAGYTWTAGSLRVADSLGNNVQNTREIAVNGRINLLNLYNKSPFLKRINSPTGGGGQGRNERTRAGSGKAGSAEANAQKDTTNAKKPPELKVIKAVLRSLMTIRTINLNYSLQEGTMLAGYLRGVNYFGLSDLDGAPGIPFVLGDQNTSIKRNAAQNGWISNSQSLNTPFSQSRNITLGLRTSFEPVRDFKITADAKKTANQTYSEIFRFSGQNQRFETNNPLKSGSYTISIISIRTAFIRSNEKNESPVFQNFIQNRSIIRQRLEDDNLTPGGNYGINSPDVLINSFYAAYTGTDPTKNPLTPFPAIPLPNWRIDYAGLNRVGFFKKYFNSINITHNYSSTYAVGTFNSSADYGASFVQLSDFAFYPNPTLTNADGEFIPVYVIGNVLITERFAPLLGVNMRTKSNITINMQYKRDRSLSLNVNNSEVTEVSGADVVTELGFAKSNLKVPFRVQGRVVSLKNELNARMSLTVRDTRTVQRKIEDVQTVTAGTLIIQIRPNISYQFNQRLNIQAYFERNVTTPRISSSFKTANTSFGIQARFSLSN
jgi:cell surface protein SprA